MRIEAKLPPAGLGTAGRAVQSVGGVHAIKPLVVNAYQAQEAGMRGHHKVTGDTSESGTCGWRGLERRRSNRRVSQQPILIELRSGRDRRHQVSCDSGSYEHIDAEA